MKKKPATKKLYSDPNEKKIAKKPAQAKKSDKLSGEKKKKNSWEMDSESEKEDFMPLKSKNVPKQPAKK